VVIDIFPLFPTLEVPVDIAITPLTPDTPAFAVAKLSDPLDVATPYPDRSIASPPVIEEDSPLDITNIPPVPLSPLPTIKYIDPPRPDEADPVPTYITPLPPLLDEPVLNTTLPLTPRIPAFIVAIDTLPLVEVVL
jgi:hypothetical protein